MRKPKAKVVSGNYMDKIPHIAENHEWRELDDGIVEVDMLHKGFYAKIAQKFFHRPRVSHIDLDKQGSFVFRQIDGRRTVGQLAQRMKEQFGDGAEPLYERLVHYMQILHNNKFILFQGKDRVKP